MKQRITVGQLNELTDEQKQRLREWWQPEPGDMAAIWGVAKGPLLSKDSLPLLSIGQCIDLVEYKGLRSVNPVVDHDVITKIEGWDVEVNNYYFKAKELVDALWEAVKEVL